MDRGLSDCLRLGYLSNIIYTLIGDSMFWGNLQRRLRGRLSRGKGTSCERGTSRLELFLAFAILAAGAVIIIFIVVKS